MNIRTVKTGVNRITERRRSTVVVVLAVIVLIVGLAVVIKYVSDY